MPPRISLALTFHNHQPIGNFGWVVAGVYEQAYRPMVEALLRHPGVRVGLHYSGPLLEWLAAERPAFLDQIRALANRGQVEILGGGLHEPILIALIDRDRHEQLVRMADRVQELVGIRPRGAWLAERVWEPDLPATISAAGYDWTIVDDTHFRAAALPEEALWGAWVTEDQGRRLTVFGTEQGLRYLIPFGRVEDVIEHLRRHATEAGDRLGTMGDDGEKFGGWPTTHEHSWGAGRWVETFFEALEANADWLTTVTPSSWLERHPPRGLAYLPDSSYAEMGEWALPAGESRAFSKRLHDALEQRLPEARWLRGALWRSFMVKYREANDLHKQMLRASAAVHEMAPGAAREVALDHLLRGQSNDPYWHGLFGGLYLADLRVAALRHLIAAQDGADAAGGYVAAAEVADLDADGREEAVLSDSGQVVTVDLAEGAGIGAWDLRAARHPMTAVLRRRPESYHALLRDLDVRARETATAEAAAAASGVNASEHGARSGEDVRDPGAPASIHDLIVAKEQNLAARIQYDDHERRFGLVTFLRADATAEDVAAGTAHGLGDLTDGAFDLVSLLPGTLVAGRDAQLEGAGGAPLPVHVEKTIRLGGKRTSPTLEIELVVENRSDETIEARIGLEVPTMLLGGGGNPSAWVEVGGRRTGHDSSGATSQVTRYSQGNDHLGVAITTAVEPAGDVWWAPIETISNSESGFERAYQGCGMLVSWLRRLAPGERFTATTRHHAAISHDQAAAQAAMSNRE